MSLSFIVIVVVNLRKAELNWTGRLFNIRLGDAALYCVFTALAANTKTELLPELL